MNKEKKLKKLYKKLDHLQGEFIYMKLTELRMKQESGEGLTEEEYRSLIRYSDFSKLPENVAMVIKSESHFKRVLPYFVGSLALLVTGILMATVGAASIPLFVSFSTLGVGAFAVVSSWPVGSTIENHKMEKKYANFKKSVDKIVQEIKSLNPDFEYNPYFQEIQELDDKSKQYEEHVQKKYVDNGYLSNYISKKVNKSTETTSENDLTMPQ